MLQTDSKHSHVLESDPRSGAEILTEKGPVHCSSAECLMTESCYPPPLCKPPPLAISPPHPGDRHFHVFLVNMYCAGLCCASALRMALHCFPISSNQAPVCVLSYSLSKGVVWVCGGQKHLCWMKHIGINAKVASRVFSLLASVEGTTVCLKIPLQSPPPPRETVT